MCSYSVCSDSVHAITVNAVLHRGRRKVWRQHHLKGSRCQGWGLVEGGKMYAQLRMYSITAKHVHINSRVTCMATI